MAVTNLSACPIRCTIGGADYSAQVVDSYSFRYQKLQAGVAGGVLPFSGQIALGFRQQGTAHPINNRLTPSLFAITTPVIFEIQFAQTWYPLPPMEVESANYNSQTQRTTLAVGDRLHLSSRIPQDVDSKALDIRIGGLRDGLGAILRLLAEIGIPNTNVFFEAEDSLLRFRHPRNFGTNYIQAIADIANSESWVVYTRPDGQIVIRETWTVVTDALVNTPDYSAPTYPLPVLGKYRYGKRKAYEDQTALDRPLEEFIEIAMPSLAANIYSSNTSYYEIHETENPQVSQSPDGTQKTVTNFDFSSGTVERTTTIRENGSDIYAGVAVAPSGEVESEIRTEYEQYDSGEPGRLVRQVDTEEIRVAKIAKSLLGWYAANGVEDEDINEDGEVTAIPFPGALWTSLIDAQRTERNIYYEEDRSTVISYEITEVQKAGISLFDGLTNGVPWDLIIEASPIALGSLRFASRTTKQWIEADKGSWEYLETHQTIHALSDTGRRSAIIGGLQKAADESDPNLAAFWLAHALRRVTTIRQRIPASPDNIPPSFTPKPRRYRGQEAAVERELQFSWSTGLPQGITQNIPKSVSIPFVSDENASNEGDLRAKSNTDIILRQVARRDRMERFSYELTTPLYPEILEGFSPYAAMDVYQESEDATFRVITAGLSITGNGDEAVIHCIAPTLARVTGDGYVHPYEETAGEN